MALTLRKYQQDAVDALALDIKRGFRRLCLSLPTGAGKSLVMSALCSRAVKKGSRVLVLAHQSELLLQNEAELKNLMPELKTGVYCSKLGRKEFDKPVVFASRDSLGRKPLQGGQFNLILIDEAHLVNFAELKKDTTGNYAKILNAQDPNVVIIGLTATPFRKKEYIYNRGKIANKFFQKLSYKITMEELIREKYLVPYLFPSQEAKLIDADHVKIDSTGDYNIEELEKISMTDATVKKCLTVWKNEASHRKLSLFFCCSRNHARVVLDELEKIEIKVGYIDGETNTNEREKILADAALGHYQALVNVNVLTTGINMRNIDCVVFLRATRSPSLFVQMLGRGARPFSNKYDFLALDMAGNFERFGSPDEPNLRAAHKSERAQMKKEIGEEPGRDSPRKICPNCEESCHVALTKCYECNHIFFNHSTNPFRNMLQQKSWKKVIHVKISDHITKEGELGWKKVEFSVFAKTISNYYLFVPPYLSESRRQYLNLLMLCPKNPSVWGFKIPIEIEVEEGIGAKQFILNWRPLSIEESSLSQFIV